MRFFLFSCALFACSAVNGQQNKLQPLVKGPQIKFDTPEIIDTITEFDLDTNCFCVAGDNKYIFAFTNIGNEPLIVQFTFGSDPDFNCYYPKEPIAPGHKGEIIICAERTRFRMDKYYTINCNSVLKQTIHIKRVKAFNDSTVLKTRRIHAPPKPSIVNTKPKINPDSLPGNLKKQKIPGQQKTSTVNTKPQINTDSLPDNLKTQKNPVPQKASIVNTKIKINLDSFPRHLKKEFSKIELREITIDTSTEHIYLDIRAGTPPKIRVCKGYVPEIFIVILDGKKTLYYNSDYELIQKVKVRARKSFNSNYKNVRIIKTIAYKNNKRVKATRTKKIVRRIVFLE